MSGRPRRIHQIQYGDYGNSGPLFICPIVAEKLSNQLLIKILLLYVQSRWQSLPTYLVTIFKLSSIILRPRINPASQPWPIKVGIILTEGDLCSHHAPSANLHGGLFYPKRNHGRTTSHGFPNRSHQSNASRIKS